MNRYTRVIDSLGRSYTIDHEKLSKAVRKALKRPEVRDARRRGAVKRAKVISRLWRETNRYANVHSESANKKRGEAHSRYYKVHPRKLSAKIKKIRETYASGEPSAKISRARKDYLSNGGLSILRKLMKNNPRWQTRMNKPELKLYRIMKKMGWSYKWTGGGRGRVKSFSPDFMHTHFRWIVELYGRYWHAKLKDRDSKRIAEIKREGYRVLILWDDDLKDVGRVKKKIRAFHKACLHVV